MKQQIQNRFFQTKTFKGLVDNYSKSEKVKIVPQKELKKKEKTIEILKKEKLEIETKIPVIVAEEVQKLQTYDKHQALRYRNIANFNSAANPDHKPLSDLSFSMLRRMVNVYPIARACVNRRIRQITQLGWDISTVDEIENEKGYEKQIQLVKDLLKQPMGHKTRMRELLTLMVDDTLTIDATCFELQKTRGGEYLSLIPVDPTTIVLRVTEQGGTPVPPDFAYEQIIGGQKINSFTTDEMIYEVMNPRSYTPYGLAPMESLILQVESALMGALYNLSYFKESNVPEGFITLPEDVVANRDAVEDWQNWFDVLMAGNPKFQHRLKILPGGGVYTPAKKPEDMAFERFEIWLLQQTCAVFDVQPQDIGITLHVNKASAESQEQVGDERGLYPLANFIKEIFDDLIQVELGFTDLQWTWRNLNPVDRKEEADIAKTEIEMGAVSVDEYRIAQGKDPIGMKHYVNTPSGPIFVDDLISGKVGPAASQASANEQNKNKDEKVNTAPVKEKTKEKFETVDFSKEDLEHEKNEIDDLRRWKKAIYQDLEKGRDLRLHFPSDYIRPGIHKEIEERLSDVTSKAQAKVLFDEYIDPEIKASMTLLKFAKEIKDIEKNNVATT